MKESIPLLLSIAAIILLVGILGIASIVLLSKRSRYRPVKPHSPVEEHDKKVDAWQEAGKRLHEEYPEQDT